MLVSYIFDDLFKILSLTSVRLVYFGSRKRNSFEAKRKETIYFFSYVDFSNLCFDNPQHSPPKIIRMIEIIKFLCNFIFIDSSFYHFTFCYSNHDVNRKKEYGRYPLLKSLMVIEYLRGPTAAIDVRLLRAKNRR